MSELAQLHYLKDDRMKRLVYKPPELERRGNEYADVVEQLMPRAWRLQLGHFWTHAMSPRRRMPLQGWKIHISSTLGDAKEVLGRAARLCIEADTEFKFAADAKILDRLLSKNCSRELAGKFMTIYPASSQEFKALLDALHAALAECSGPYILSDRRYKQSRTVHYRYGGFQSMPQPTNRGGTLHCIVDADYKLVEDQRQPYFSIPPFITPFWLKPASASPPAAAAPATSTERSNGSETDSKPAAPSRAFSKKAFGGDYLVESAIKFSSAGGVYIANSISSNTKTLLKEARPYISMEETGISCVELLEKEYRLLCELEPFAIAPRPLALFKEWEHTFIAQSFVSGLTLQAYNAANFVFIKAEPPGSEIQRALLNMVKIAINLTRIVQVLHRHGIIYGDLSPSNVIIDPETLELRLIDFEAAVKVGVDAQLNLFTQGYGTLEREQRKVIEFADDRYALGAMMLFLASPNPSAEQLQPGFAMQVTQALEREYGLPPQYSSCMLGLLRGDISDLDTVLALLHSISAADIGRPEAPPPADTASTPSIEQIAARIFGFNEAHFDSEQLRRPLPLSSRLRSPAALDHGVAGVAYAWQIVCGAVPAKVSSWVERRCSEPVGLPGLLNGMAGNARVLWTLGMKKAAKAMLEACSLHQLLYECSSLGYGAAGFGMVCLELAQQCDEQCFLDLAQRTAQALCEQAQHHEDYVVWGPEEGQLGRPIGLHSGPAGTALFLLYAYCQWGDETFLRVGERALRHDLYHGYDGGQTIGFPQWSSAPNNIVYPYLNHGTAGVASVLLRYFSVTKSPVYAALLERLRPSLVQKYTVSPSLFEGITGIGNYHLDAFQLLGDSRYLGYARRAAQGLALFEISTATGAAFPCAVNHAISCDYANGSAGVALFVDRLRSNKPNFHLPLDEILCRGRAHQASAALQVAELQFGKFSAVTLALAKEAGAA